MKKLIVVTVIALAPTWASAQQASPLQELVEKQLGSAVFANLQCIAQGNELASKYQQVLAENTKLKADLKAAKPETEKPAEEK